MSPGFLNCSPSALIRPDLPSLRQRCHGSVALNHREVSKCQLSNCARKQRLGLPSRWGSLLSLWRWLRDRRTGDPRRPTRRRSTRLPLSQLRTRRFPRRLPSSASWISLRSPLRRAITERPATESSRPNPPSHPRLRTLLQEDPSRPLFRQRRMKASPRPLRRLRRLSSPATTSRRTPPVARCQPFRPLQRRRQ
jgi:hypothetical protein